MSAGRFENRLRRGIKRRAQAQLYVRRRTNKRGSNRVLVVLEPALRYAICVWASHRPGLRQRAVAQELRLVIEEGLKSRLGSEFEEIIEETYELYAKQCAEAGETNIFEVATDA